MTAFSVLRLTLKVLPPFSLSDLLVVLPMEAVSDGGRGGRALFFFAEDRGGRPIVVGTG